MRLKFYLLYKWRMFRYFTPNMRTHPEFARALVHARDQGVFVQALWCRVGKDTLEIAGEVPVVL